MHIEDMSVEQGRRLAERGHLWAVVDACDAPSVSEKMRALGAEKAVSLFQEDYWAVAPYLVWVDTEILDWLHQNLWNDPWGIFILAQSPLRELYQHFLKWLVVQLPDQRNWLFRYYDPRVLNEFLRTCNLEELKTFYGPVKGYAVKHDQDHGCRAFLML